MQSYLYIIEHTEVADEFITSKNKFHAIFHDSLGNKPQWKALVTCGKTLQP